jgi:hypothetical protein
MASLPKAMFINTNGGAVPRPEKQDKIPKAFKGQNALIKVAFSEPTDRYVLWILANNPYCYNAFFHSDYTAWSKPPITPNNIYPLYKHMAVLKSLQDRQFIEHPNGDLFIYKITLKGQLFRLHTHPAFQPSAIIVGLIIAALAILPNPFNGKNNGKKPQEDTTQIKASPPFDSALLKQPQNQSEIKKDSSALHNDTSKTQTKLHPVK